MILNLAACLSEPFNPIPSDAFAITKRSTFLNVFKKLLSIDEHLDSEKFSTLTLCSPYHLLLQSKKYVPAKSKNCKLFAVILMLGYQNMTFHNIQTNSENAVQCFYQSLSILST
jgi:hypothetical protein